MSKKLIKFMLVFGFLVLAMAAVVILRPVDTRAVAADPTATPTAAAPAPTATPVPFTGKADVVSMSPAFGGTDPKSGAAMNIKVARGDDPTKSFAAFSAGTKNVPPGVPVFVQAGAISLAQGAKLTGYTWTLKAPSGSTAAIAPMADYVKKAKDTFKLTYDVAADKTADKAAFTPDKEGEYVVGIVVTDSKGAKSVAGELKITAAKYVGSEVCAGCHKDQYEGWSKTAHGHAFNSYVSMNVEAEYWTAGFSCARCHTVGYYPVAGNGGWWDTFVNTLKLNWTKGEFTVTTKDKDGKDVQTKYNSIAEAIAFNGNPDFSAVDDKGAVVKGPVYGSLDPKLQAVSNIGCESCHGPAGAHVAKPSADNAPMTSADGSSCEQCHNGGGHHTRGEAISYSAHSHNAELEEGNRAGCNACHSAEGFVDVAAGKAPADARKIDSNIGCATCHDPHSEKNPFQLRVVNDVTLPAGATKVTDAGLSAVCMSCHNNRTDANDPKTGVAAAFPGPHYSSAAEQIAGVGGYTFGATIKNGYHTNIGKGVLTDEAGNALNGGVAPGACVLCHMSQTPGGVGNNAASMAMPGHQAIGGHSFNMTDGKTENVAVCQQCHPGVTSFNFTAPADYDGNGKPEGVQTEIKNLLDITWNNIVTKAVAEKITITKQASYPYYTLTPMDKTVTKATPSTELKAAIYNYRYVYGLMWNGANIGGYGKGAAIHNFERSVGLLQVTIEKMKGTPLSTDPKTTLLYSLPKPKK